MHGGVVLRFTAHSATPTAAHAPGGDRNAVVESAAKHLGNSTRLVAITGGTRHEGKRAVIADVYDLETGESTCIVQRWRLTLTLHGKLAGKPFEIGPAWPLPRGGQRRLP